jgi:hypothetical protein
MESVILWISLALVSIDREKSELSVVVYAVLLGEHKYETP